MSAHWKAEWWGSRPRWKTLPWRAEGSAPGMWRTPRRRNLVGRPAEYTRAHVDAFVSAHDEGAIFADALARAGLAEHRCVPIDRLMRELSPPPKMFFVRQLEIDLGIAA